MYTMLPLIILLLFAKCQITGICHFAQRPPDTVTAHATMPRDHQILLRHMPPCPGITRYCYKCFLWVNSMSQMIIIQFYKLVSWWRKKSGFAQNDWGRKCRVKIGSKADLVHLQNNHWGSVSLMPKAYCSDLTRSLSCGSCLELGKFFK